MDRDFSIELVRVTEEAALAAARWTGKGNKEKADEAATQAMRRVFNTIPMHGTVVIGEGEMDQAPMLYIGEQLGAGYGPDVDIAVDPLEGTNIVADGTSNAIAVVAVADQGNLLHAPDMYMEKIAVGKAAKGKIDINAPIIENLKAVAEAKNKQIEDIVVAILNRERHKKVIQEVRKAGARIKLIQDGEVATIVTAGFESSGVDMILGSGGAPEGVLAAVALKCLEGDFQGRLLPKTDEEFVRLKKMGIRDVNQPLFMEDIVKGNDAFFVATGVTDGELLKGVQFGEGVTTTYSIVMCARTRTVRFIEGKHSRS